MDLMSRVARRSSDHSDQYRVFVVSFYTMDSHQSPFSAAPFIREIARGKKGARDLSREDARMLFTAMLNSEVSDLELGGFLIGMRIKGESVAEIAGFLDAVESSFDALPMPEAEFAPVVIPSYNGSRQMPNLTPLLAMLLASEGVPVLIHGLLTDPGRVTSAEILQLLGVQPVMQQDDRHDVVLHSFEKRQPVFFPIQWLAPRVHRLLEVRRILGLRNSTHTLVKIMQPFMQPALRLVSYTHPEYLTMLSDYFSTQAPAQRGDAFLMRGTEGETVANAKRAQSVTWFHNNQSTVLVEKQSPVDELPPLPVASDAKTTALWITEVLAHRQPVPEPIAEQVRQCLNVARQLKKQNHE
jgi:anthranilate phosphoribosyltransferase